MNRTAAVSRPRFHPESETDSTCSCDARVLSAGACTLPQRCAMVGHGSVPGRAPPVKRSVDLAPYFPAVAYRACVQCAGTRRIGLRRVVLKLAGPLGLHSCCWPKITFGQRIEQEFSSESLRDPSRRARAEARALEFILESRLSRCSPRPRARPRRWSSGRAYRLRPETARPDAGFRRTSSSCPPTR